MVQLLDVFLRLPTNRTTLELKHSTAASAAAFASSTNRTTLELKLVRTFPIFDIIFATNRTTLELKQSH